MNPKITQIRLDQGWIDEKISDLDELVTRVQKAQTNKETISIAYLGNVVEVWEKFDKSNIHIDLGSDQTSLHNPWAGGYYPVGLSFEDANDMMANNPDPVSYTHLDVYKRQPSSVDLEANYLELGETTSYNVESIAYNPPYQFDCLANPVSVNTDDVWSPTVNLPFDFCFYGQTYNSCVIGSNGVISFDSSLAGGPTGWRIDNNLPSNVANASNGTTDYFYGPSIFGVHHDLSLIHI